MKRAILLVDHGSRRADANALLGQVADSLRSRLPDTIVEIAHMELEPPSIAAGIQACVEAGARELTLHPYFLAPGVHTRETIPNLVEAALAQHPGVVVKISEPLGLHEGLVDVVLERIEEVG